MFTGIIEETGVIKEIRPHRGGIHLVIASAVCAEDIAIGDSLAVNGCCLTVVKRLGKKANWLLQFDLLAETWDRTNFSHATPGDAVNLERSLRPEGRLHGHFVTGHIDGVGKISRWERRGADWLLEFSVPVPLRRYLAKKGSIAVDGISLTIAATNKSGCQIWIIPHTLDVTALKERSQGDLVNIETDILAKYVAGLVRNAVRQ